MTGANRIIEDPYFMYVHNIPHPERRKLCEVLDINNRWEELGGKYMNYDAAELNMMKKHVPYGDLPANMLLFHWQTGNKTVLELFVLLCDMRHYEAMKVIKHLVNPEYHKLLSYENTEAHAAEKSGLNKLDVFKMNNSSGAVACPPHIEYYQLTQATDNWSEKNILGKGGFGTVYLGFWKHTSVAIKLLKDKKVSEMFSNELMVLGLIRHDNILPLYGYSIGEEAHCLIYQFLHNGSLEDRLRCKNKTKPLAWVQRLRIAIGTATGLQFLHSVLEERPLIHGDIKSANILLDKDFEPKIGDFGLTQKGPTMDHTHLNVKTLCGTVPYLPQEFLRRKILTVKLDTFSFGVVLFEIATGKRAYDRERKTCLYDEVLECRDNNLHELIDPKADTTSGDVAVSLMQLGKRCVQSNYWQRPDMESVLDHLNGIAVDNIRPLTPPIVNFHKQQHYSIPNTREVKHGTQQGSFNAHIPLITLLGMRKPSE